MTNYNQLNISQRETIQILFNKGKSFTEIGLAIGKDRTTISKEIRRNRYAKSYHYDAFDKKAIQIALEGCKILKKRYVCNNCPLKSTCNKQHLFYDYRQAQKHYEELLVETRFGVDITPETIEEIERQIIPLIKDKKQSVNQVYINHPDILYFSKATFYKYVDLGIFSLTNADLPKKIRYKKRKSTKNNHSKRELALLNGRRYEDFIVYIADHPRMNIVEMDTVIGKVESKKCLLTFFIRKTHFMLVFLLNKKDSASVNAKVNFLKEKLGTNLYSKVFRIILTDNGSEFFSVFNFERDLNTSNKIANIFFCHSYSPYEKHGIEVNHEYIRRVFPKGTSFADLDDDIIKRLQDNINAVPRQSLAGETPFNLTKKLYPEFIEKLNCDFIEPDDVTLNEDDITLLKKH